MTPAFRQSMAALLRKRAEGKGPGDAVTISVSMARELAHSLDTLAEMQAALQVGNTTKARELLGAGGA